MLIESVDSYNDLFRVENIFPDHLVQDILSTDWLSLPWQRQEGQETWARRRINEQALPWLQRWNSQCEQLWPTIAKYLGISIKGYQGTAWWLDEPGFTCSLHTDGEMPGALQVSWHGPADLGTAFYHYKNLHNLRYQFPMQTNCGYIMINSADAVGYRHLQWHGMLQPVPANTYRLNSYSWITPTI